MRVLSVLDLVRPERVFVETDHPYGNRSSRDRPGNVVSLERQLSLKWGMTPDQIRESQWRNLSNLVSETGTMGMFPMRIR